MGFSLLGVNRGYSLVVVHRLLVVVASLVVEYRLEECRLQKLQHVGSVVVEHGLSCSMARGIFPDQGLNLCLLHWQGGLFTTEPPGKPSNGPLSLLCLPLKSSHSKI